jgi:hypothetical protein
VKQPGFPTAPTLFFRCQALESQWLRFGVSCRLTRRPGGAKGSHLSLRPYSRVGMTMLRRHCYGVHVSYLSRTSHVDRDPHGRYETGTRQVHHSSAVETRGGGRRYGKQTSAVSMQFVSGEHTRPRVFRAAPSPVGTARHQSPNGELWKPPWFSARARKTAREGACAPHFLLHG